MMYCEENNMVSIKEKNFISIVAYVHDNENELQSWLEHTLTIMETHFDKYEIVFVDDHSIDKSVAVIKKFAKEFHIGHIVNIINMSYYHGLEASMNAGVDLAIGDFVYEFDNLMIEYEQELIWKVYQHSLQGYDIVSAVSDENVDAFSALFYKIYNWAKRQEGSSYSLQRESFRVLSRRAINRVKAMGNFIPYRKAMYINCGLPCDSILYKTNKSIKKSYDKKQMKSRRELAIDSLILFTDSVTKITLLISFLFFAFALLTGGYTVFVYLSSHHLIEGWAPIMGFLSAGFGGVFIILTIIVKYLSLALNMLFKKQSYFIKSIEKITD